MILKFIVYAILTKYYIQIKKKFTVDLSTRVRIPINFNTLLSFHCLYSPMVEDIYTLNAPYNFEMCFQF